MLFKKQTKQKFTAIEIKKIIDASKYVKETEGFDDYPSDEDTTKATK